MTDTQTISHKLMDVEFMLPDAGATADAVVEAGLAYCADKMHLATADAVVASLRAGNRMARAYFEYGLAKQLAEQLGELDNEVQSAYLYEADATAEDIILGDAQPTLIHLIIQARRKTSALTSLLTALERALATSYADRMATPDLLHIVDIQVADESAIATGTGYGAMLTWLHHRPLPVWTR